MDTAVALVQCYLRVNGYFTVSEYPVIEALDGAQHREMTDLDILAFRFPHAGHLIARGPMDVHHHASLFSPDTALGADPDEADMIVG
jgi:hypothetical protein